MLHTAFTTGKSCPAEHAAWLNLKKQSPGERLKTLFFQFEFER